MQVDLKFKIKAGDGQITFPIYRVPVSGGTEPVDAGDIQNLQVDLDRQVLQSSQEGVMVTAAYSNVAEGTHRIVITGALNDVAFALVYAVRAEELGVPAEVVAPNAYVSLAPTGEGTIEQQIKDLQDRMGTAEGEIVAITATLPDMATKEEVQETLGEILAAIQALPDGQAVSAQVALNTAAIEGLEAKIGNPSFSVKFAFAGFEVVSANSIKLSGVRYINNNGVDSGLIYINSETHEKVLYTFGPGAYHLVLKANNSFEMLASISLVEGGDQILLSYDSDYGFSTGVLLPLVNGIRLASHDNKINGEQLTATFETLKAISAKDGNKISSSSWKASSYVDVSKFKAVYLTTVGFYEQAERGTALYDENHNFLFGIPFPSGYEDFSDIVIRIETNGAKYLRTTYYRDETGHSSFSLISEGIDKGVEYAIENLPSLTHLRPENEGQFNVVRRARQMTDIEWTPAFDIPRLQYLGADPEENYPSTGLGFFGDVFKAGVTYRGIPYARADKESGQWNYNTFKVGIYVPFETFITAVMNKGSIVQNKSVLDVPNHDACFYATVCAAMVSYALGLPYVTSVNFPTYPGMSTLGLVSGFDLKKLKLADVLHSSEHTAIITDVIRKNGETRFVEISEATPLGNDNNAVLGTDEEGGKLGGVCRRRWWTAQDFLHDWGIYSILRFDGVPTVQYEPSPYVPMEDEVAQVASHKMACMPYPGNAFTYYEGYIPNTDILIFSNGFSYLRILKDGDPWNQDGTTNYYSITGLSKVAAGFTTAGEYEAYLCNVSDGVEIKKSKSCKWVVKTIS